VMQKARITGVVVTGTDGKRSLYTLSPSPGCKDTFTQQNKYIDPRYGACLVNAPMLPETDRDRQEDNLVLLMDRSSTLKLDNRYNVAGGNLELRLRKGGKDQLVDYWEHLNPSRPRFFMLEWAGWRPNDHEFKGSAPGRIEFVLRNLK
jgi:hypothetical protein